MSALYIFAMIVFVCILFNLIYMLRHFRDIGEEVDSKIPAGSVEQSWLAIIQNCNFVHLLLVTNNPPPLEKLCLPICVSRIDYCLLPLSILFPFV